jgi:hypothetical protein
MSVNAKSMAASYAVLIRRARQRNRDLPSATFRWSAGSFYCYLARRCYDWGHYRYCLLYVRKAVCADPVWLLNTWTCRTLMDALVNAGAGLMENRCAEQVRLSPKKVGTATEWRPQEGKKRLFILNRIFNHIALKRWLAVVHDGD